MEATLYDGFTAQPHRVLVTWTDVELSLSQVGGWAESVPIHSLTRPHSHSADYRLGRSDLAGWRLILPADCAAEIDRRLGKAERYGRWIDRVGLVPALIVGSLITAAVVGLGHVGPHWLAPYVPHSWERNLGTAIVGDFGKYRCRNAPGQRALEALAERLSPGITTGPTAVQLAALDVAVFNAAAIPGDRIVIFRPAITETHQPEELAGILAHEIAHVKRRHVTEALLRELGIGALIRLFAGDVGANAEQLVALSYTRGNEAEADADAIAMLKRANISPMPTARLFTRLAKDLGEGGRFDSEFLQSHPLSRNRAGRFAAAFDSKAQYSPALPRDQAEALLNICPKTKPVKVT